MTLESFLFNCKFSNIKTSARSHTEAWPRSRDRTYELIQQQNFSDDYVRGLKFENITRNPRFTLRMRFIFHFGISCTILLLLRKKRLARRCFTFKINFAHCEKHSTSERVQVQWGMKCAFCSTIVRLLAVGVQWTHIRNFESRIGGVWLLCYGCSSDLDKELFLHNSIDQ